MINLPHEEKLPPRAYIDVEIQPFIEHVSRVRCGSYTTEWVARVMGIDGPSSNELLAKKGPNWLDYFRPIPPVELVKLLKQRGLESMVMALDPFSQPSSHLDWIRKEIATKKKPILVLVKTSFLHWLVIAGYDDEKGLLYVYDPSYGKTSVNHDVPAGNKDVAYQRFMNDWVGRWNFQYIVITILSNAIIKKEITEDNKVTQETDDSNDLNKNSAPIRVQLS